MTKPILTASCAVCLLAVWLHAQPPTQPPVAPPQPPAQPTEIETRLSSEGGSAPRLAIPDFIAVSTDAETVDIAKKIEIAYCKDKPSYYPGGNCSYVWLDTAKPLSLDMEIKVLPDGNLQFKQVREFHGR